MTHCRTVGHIARLYGVDEAELKRVASLPNRLTQAGKRVKAIFVANMAANLKRPALKAVIECSGELRSTKNANRMLVYRVGESQYCPIKGELHDGTGLYVQPYAPKAKPEKWGGNRLLLVDCLGNVKTENGKTRADGVQVVAVI